MVPRRVLPDPPVCLITDETVPPHRVVETVRRALEGGVRWVQLRRRSDPGRCLLRVAHDLRELTGACSATLVVNERVDVALACEADGVHLPATAMPAAPARALLGETRLLGRSIHSAAETAAAENRAVDYFQFGPVFETPSKRRYGSPQGLAALHAAVHQAAPRPVVAVGGIRQADLAGVIETGAAGVAMIGAFASATDVRRTSEELIETIATARAREQPPKP